MSKKKKSKKKRLKSLKYPLPPENQIVQLYSKFKSEPSENNNSLPENNNNTSTAEEQPLTQ